MNDKIIEELYIKYAGDGRDSQDVASDIINELMPRKDYSDDSSYYMNIHIIWQLIQKYIDSTYNLSIKPIFQQKCEYADIEYISESIYEQLAQYVHEHNTIDMTELTKGEFEILVNWKNT